MKMGNYCIANIYACKPLIQPGDATNFNLKDQYQILLHIFVCHHHHYFRLLNGMTERKPIQSCR